MIKVAAELDLNPNLDFGLIDLSLNDPLGLSVEETPMLHLYKPGSSIPYKHRGPMKKYHIFKFLEHHLGSKLNEYILQQADDNVEQIEVYRSSNDSDM